MVEIELLFCYIIEILSMKYVIYHVNTINYFYNL